jgi:TRAP-type mannitol/chloroaromatic compound transport system substrate-binding protein
VIVNRDRYAELPEDLKKIVEVAARATSQETLADFVFHNVETLDVLRTEHGIEFRTFPDDVVQALGTATREVLEELAGTDELTGRVDRSFRAFLAKANRYSALFDQRLLAMRGIALGA